MFSSHRILFIYTPSTSDFKFSTILMNFSNYLPCSHLSPLKPGGHVQPFLFENPPLRHSEESDTDFSCHVLSKIFDILYLAQVY